MDTAEDNGPWKLKELAEKFSGEGSLREHLGDHFLALTTEHARPFAESRALTFEQGTWDVPGTREPDPGGETVRTYAPPGLGSELSVFALRKIRAAGGDGVLVGRDGHCDIVLHHGSVSRTHAAFFSGWDGELKLLDMGSRNGTSVSGEPAASSLTPEAGVTSGEQVRFGDVGCTILDAKTLSVLVRAIAD